VEPKNFPVIRLPDYHGFSTSGWGKLKEAPNRLGRQELLFDSGGKVFLHNWWCPLLGRR